MSRLHTDMLTIANDSLIGHAWYADCTGEIVADKVKGYCSTTIKALLQKPTSASEKIEEEWLDDVARDAITHCIDIPCVQDIDGRRKALMAYMGH